MTTPVFCSLGTLCHSANILKRIGWKHCSFPFDWIFSSPDTIIHCLDTDFSTFLDRSFFVDEGDDDKCGHTFYYPCGKTMFNHKNPLKNEEDYQYYFRCVNRFRALLQQPDHKVFTMMWINMSSENVSREKANIIEQVKRLRSALLRKTNHFEFLVIFHYPDASEPFHSFFQVEEEGATDGIIQCLELRTRTWSKGVVFDDDRDNDYFDEVLKKRY